MAENEVNLRSVDAMFATLIAEQKANHAALMTRMSGQDEALKQIIAKADYTNGRVTGLETRENARSVRMATLASVFTAVGGLLAWVVEKLLT